MTMRTWALTAAELTGLANTSISVDGVTAATPASVNAPALDDWTVSNGNDATVATKTLDLNAGNNVLYSGSANVDLVAVTNLVSSSKTTVNGGAGTDTITVAATNAGHVTVNGGAGVDTIVANSTAVDATTGAAFTKVVYDSTDVLNAAGTGRFVLDNSASSAGVNWDISGATTTALKVAATGIVIDAASTATVDSVTGLIGSSAADTLKGGSLAAKYTLDGGNGADKLYAAGILAGTTTTFVYDANDAVVKGAALGTDILDASSNTSGISLFLNDPGSKFTVLDQVVGGSGSDNIRGGQGVTVIGGGKGNDYIWAGTTGGVAMNGGAGDDQFWYGASEGAQTINSTGTEGVNDVVNLYNISAYDLVGADKFTNAGVNGVLNIGGSAANTLTMGAASGNTSATRHFTSQEGWAFDVTFGDAAGSMTGTANVTDNMVAQATKGTTFDGKGGNDNLYGTTAADTFNFYKGDVIYSGGGNDTITAINSAAGVQMYLDDAVNTTYSSATSWSVVGSGYDDEIRGQNGVTLQTLNGGAGNDAIWGGAGALNVDTLIGGAGVDTYYYGIDEGNDTVAAGAIGATGNAGDILNFYNVADVSKLSGTVNAANDMVISVTGAAGTSTLTLSGWNSGSINKMTDVVISGKGYTLGADASGNATFTAK